MHLVALKPLLYGTRRLQAGDEFEAPKHHATPLIAVKKARDVMRGKLDPPPPKLERQAERNASEAPDAERDALRALADGLGIPVDGRWGVDRLKEEIAAARQAAVAPAASDAEPKEAGPAAKENGVDEANAGSVPALTMKDW